MTASVIPLLTTDEAAATAKVSKRWMERRRTDGDGPEYVKFGGVVRYPADKLQDWVSVHLRRSTSQPAPVPTIPYRADQEVTSVKDRKRPTVSVERDQQTAIRGGGRNHGAEPQT